MPMLITSESTNSAAMLRRTRLNHSSCGTTTLQPIMAQYTGWLSNGTQFDSSRPRGTPATFQIGVGAVIPGWDEAVITMKVGGKRKLILPPALGYGAAGQPPTIPKNSTLVFMVELLSTAPTPSPSPSP